MSGQHWTLRISGHQRGLREITGEVNQALQSCDMYTGTCTVFVQHTSAGLCIQENADPSARRDIESWLDRMAPEDDPAYTHTAEGPDDMPAHLKAILTGTSLVIPVVEGRLALGTWQGIYLCEFRNHPGTRNIVVVIQ
jgi:secondary thiamine-phosphate synthase enzyme